MVTLVVGAPVWFPSLFVGFVQSLRMLLCVRDSTVPSLAPASPVNTGLACISVSNTLFTDLVFPAFTHGHTPGLNLTRASNQNILFFEWAGKGTTCYTAHSPYKAQLGADFRVI